MFILLRIIETELKIMGFTNLTDYINTKIIERL